MKKIYRKKEKRNKKDKYGCLDSSRIDGENRKSYEIKMEI